MKIVHTIYVPEINKRNCSDPDTFEQQAEQFGEKFISKGFRGDLLKRKIIKCVGWTGMKS